MRSSIRARLLQTAIALVATAPATVEVLAQPADVRTVTLVQLQSLPRGKQAMVFRRASGADRNVVALAPGASAADLGSALRALDALHNKFGDTLDRDIAVSVRSETAPTSLAASSARKARAELHKGFILALKQAHARTVAGFGSVRVHEIKVPKHSSRRGTK